MCQLLESIKVYNNKLVNVEYHNARLNRSRKLLLHATDAWRLEDYIAIPDLNPKQVYKCRVTYSDIPTNIEFIAYVPKIIRTLTLVDQPDIDYAHKYADRDNLDYVKRANQQTDDILIVQNQRITDTSSANIVFWDGSKWVTSATPLLKGTKRQRYLDEGLIVERDITIFDLKKFLKARIINAMIDLDQSPDIRMENIFC
jgi:4-amino-4-deoxychorismate lyase